MIYFTTSTITDVSALVGHANVTTLVRQTHWYMCRLSCSYLKLVGPSYANVATLFNQTHWHTCRLSCCHQTESSEYKGTQSHRHRHHRTPQHIEGMPFRHKTRVLCRDNVSTQAHSYPDQLPRRFLSFVRFVNCAVAFVDFRLCFLLFSSSFFFCLSLLSCILFILSCSFSFRFFSRSLIRFSLSSLSLVSSFSLYICRHFSDVTAQGYFSPDLFFLRPDASLSMRGLNVWVDNA